MLSNGEIRVLILHPAPADSDLPSPIQCDIETVVLSDHPIYEALSYVWGSETATAPIYIADRTVQISPTLHNALLRLRLPDRTRTLWIDQLCINQKDLDEKMQQVRLMREIYTFCSQCVIWMGEIREDLRLEDAEAAFQLFTYMSDLHQTGKEGKILPVAVRNNIDGMAKALQSFAYGGNQWWNRIWTVQEAALPDTLTIQWGPLTLPWSILDDSVWTWTSGNYDGTSSGEEQHSLGEVMIHCAWLHNTRSGFDKVYDLVNKWRFRQATDPRDKIYGILGLCEAGRLPVTELCDYSVPTVRVFSTLTRELIVDGKGLRALTPYPRPSIAGTTPDMPSWASDIGLYQFIDTPNMYYQLSGYGFYRADEGLGQINLENVKSGSRPEVLCLEGFRIDQVSRIEKGYRKTFDYERDFSSTEPFLRHWYDVATKGVVDDGSETQPCDNASTARYPGVNYSRKEAFLRLVLGDCMRDEGQSPQRESNSEDLDAVWKLLNLEHSNVDYNTRFTVYGMMANQNMFVTRNGLIGVGHVDLQVGDEVWIFKGGKVPFTIRRRSPEIRDGYSFLGHCYVQGIMMGEVAKGEIPGVDLVNRTVDLW